MQRTAFRCTMCGREFASKDTLEQHENESHPQSRTGGVGNAGHSGYEGAPYKEGTRPDLVPKAEFYCSVCSTTFESQEKLDTHLKTHQYA